MFAQYNSTKELFLIKTRFILGLALLGGAFFLSDHTYGSGVTLTPDPSYDTASGPTLPPDDYDEPDDKTKMASGPTLPPDDYDEPACDANGCTDTWAVSHPKVG